MKYTDSSLYSYIVSTYRMKCNLLWACNKVKKKEKPNARFSKRDIDPLFKNEAVTLKATEIVFEHGIHQHRIIIFVVGL